MTKTNKETNPTTKIYLATSYFNDKQRERAHKAEEVLAKNDTVNVVHMPFNHQYQDVSIASEDNNDMFGSPEWQKNTYGLDMTAVATSDCVVALYDLDMIDDGIAFELGLARSTHKPVILIPLSENLEEKELNLMIAQATTYFMDSIEDLETYDFNHFPSNMNPSLPVF